MWNEWKRIWRHPKRCMILLFLPVFCMFMFGEGEAEGIRISDGVEMIRHSQIYKKHVEICRSMEWETAENWLREEQDHLASASLWAGGYLEGEVMREEVEDWLQDYSDLLRLIEDTVAFRLEISWYGEMLGILESELKYLREYPEYLEQIQAQYQSQSESILFQNATPYFQRNLKKTADDFRPLTGVKLAFGHNQGLDAWLNFRLTDYVYLAILLIVVFSFLEERRKGLWDAIRSTTGGRWRLGLSRIGILSCISILYTCILYGGTLAGALALYGGWEDLGRPIQSLMAFETYPQTISIGEWLIRFGVCKMGMGIFIGCVCWVILGGIRHTSLSLLVLGLFLGIEYALYAWIPPQSHFQILKYWNFVFCIHTTDLFTQYVNLNIGGWPIALRTVFLESMLVLFLGLAGILHHIQCRQYPTQENKYWDQWIYGMQAGFDGIRTRMGNVGLEFYKHVFLEGTLLFLLAGCLLANQLTYSEGVSPQGKSIYYEEYLTDAEGPINASIDSYLSYAKEQAQGFSSALEGVMQMEERVEELRERAQQEGIVPWLVNQEYYEGFWGDKPMPLQRQNMVWMLLLVLCSTSGLVAYERQEGTLGLLRSLSDGRKRLFRRKVGIRLLTTTLIWGFFTGMEVWTICSSEAFQPNVLGAAVQNMDFLQDFPFRIRIGSYMLLLYGLRLFVLLCVAILASWIGSRMSTLQGATLVNLFILGFPALLYAMEVEAVQSITVLPLLSGNEFLRSLENIIDFWPVGLCAAAGILAYHLMKRSWVRN